MNKNKLKENKFEIIASIAFFVFISSFLTFIYFSISEHIEQKELYSKAILNNFKKGETLRCFIFEKENNKKATFVIKESIINISDKHELIFNKNKIFIKEKDFMFNFEDCQLNNLPLLTNKPAFNFKVDDNLNIFK